MKKNLDGKSPDESNVVASLLDVNGVAMMLGCSTRHVLRLNDSGRMPQSVKLGNLRRWPRSVLEQWIADGCPSVRRRKT